MSNAAIALIGYRGTGKTTVAQLLAKHLQQDWIDADVELEERAGKTIAEIFQESGEAGFREIESEVVADLCQREKLVIALGGGAILRESNRSCMANCRAVVWLKASVETISERILGDPTTAERRPNLTNHGGRTEIEEMLVQREPIYRACATLEVDTDNKAPAEIAEEIAAALGEAN